MKLNRPRTRPATANRQFSPSTRPLASIFLRPSVLYPTQNVARPILRFLRDCPGNYCLFNRPLRRTRLHRPRFSQFPREILLFLISPLPPPLPSCQSLPFSPRSVFISVYFEFRSKAFAARVRQIGRLLLSGGTGSRVNELKLRLQFRAARRSFAVSNKRSPKWRKSGWLSVCSEGEKPRRGSLPLISVGSKVLRPFLFFLHFLVLNSCKFFFFFFF